MAASAYAGLVSLMHVLDNIQFTARPKLQFDRNQIENLRDEVSFFKDFLQDHSEILCSTDNKDLARQIAEVADEAEHVIDSHVVDQRRGDKADLGPSSFSEDMDRVATKFVTIKREVMSLRERILVQDQQSGVSVRAAGSSAPPSSGKNMMVGFDMHYEQIMDLLTGGGLDLQIIPIVGMGGIGKSTLAQYVYEHPRTIDHFEIRAWVEISQDYSISEILEGLLQQMTTSCESLRWFRENELGQILKARLSNTRYLIVIDDVWSNQVWNDLELFFSNVNCGSRIIVTTRLSNVANYFSSRSHLLMHFLDGRESWNLLCQKVFGNQDCPPELEEVGKVIAKACKGLPLTIVTIGDLLANSNMKLEYWQFVAENVNSFVNSADDDSFLNVWLSYNNLPIHLKPCFLYMRIFPRDQEIRASKLIRYWVAEGFVTPRRDKTLEEVAYEYLKALVDRNLILSYQLTYGGKIKTCKITDVLRDLCLKEHEKEEFFRISKLQVANATEQSLCFLCSHQNASTRIYLPQVLVASQPTSLGKCFVCDVCLTLYSLCDRLRLVRAIRRHDGSYSVEFLQSTILRYLHVGLGYQLVFTSLHLLWNLQTIVISDEKDAIKLPSEIWEMTQLRHVKISPMAILPDPPQESHQDPIVLENLQTLSYIKIFRCLKQILERTPNLKKLGISFSSERGDESWSYYQLSNLSHLKKIESLSLHCNDIILEEAIEFPLSVRKLCISVSSQPKDKSWSYCYLLGNLSCLKKLESLSLHCNDIILEEAIAFPQSLRKLCISVSSQRGDESRSYYCRLSNLSRLQELESLSLHCNGINLKDAIDFPPSLRKLCLDGCKIPWKRMTVIGSLPDLEELKLKCNSGGRESWFPSSSQFVKLKALIMHDCDLKCLWAWGDCFPSLEVLVLQDMHYMGFMSSRIGRIPTMRSILLVRCTQSLVISTKEIIDLKNGNGQLQLHIEDCDSE